MAAVVDLKIHPPAYPLDREAFKRALRTGHGRALVHAREFGLTDYCDEVLDAATDCKVYDVSFDGQREWWLAQLCEHAGLVDTVIGLSPGDTWRNRDLRTSLLKEFCQSGREAALPALYAMCHRPAESDDVEAVGELIEVEGEKGWVFAARIMGEALLADPEFEITNYEAELYDDLQGPGSAREVLERLAPEDPAIWLYLQELNIYQEKARDRSSAVRPADFESVESVIGTILSATKPVPRLRRWGNNASPEDRSRVAMLLKNESSPIVLLNAICCLKGKGLPEYDETLLPLVFHEDDDVRFHAAQLFSHHVNPHVREAAFALLEKGGLDVATFLLRRIATDEDAGRILSALARTPEEEDNHREISNLVDMLKEGGLIREVPIPLYIYEYSPCMMCRESALEFMMGRGICPQWLLDEAAFDGSPDIRKRVTAPEA